MTCVARINFGDLDIATLEPWSLLTHSRSTWATVLPKENVLLNQLIALQKPLPIIPESYFKSGIYEPSVLLKEVYMLEAALVSYPDFNIVSIYSLSLGLRYIRHLKLESLEDKLMRDWGEIAIEMLRHNKRDFLKKGDDLFSLAGQDDPGLEGLYE